LDRIEAHCGGLDAFSKGYDTYGINRVDADGKHGFTYKEWAPNAKSAALVGDFNGWNTTAHQMRRDEYVRFVCVSANPARKFAA
jgi:1,4-alpha-glucan branching enzyme